MVWDHEAAGSSPVTSTIGMRRRFIEICGASVIRYALRAIPHNSKCRYGERGAAAAKPKAQIILCVLSSILATQMPCRTPSRSEALRSATAACGGSWRGDPPERCLSRKAGTDENFHEKHRFSVNYCDSNHTALYLLKKSGITEASKMNKVCAVNSVPQNKRSDHEKLF